MAAIRSAGVTALALLLTLAACAPGEPTRYFTLTPLATQAPAAESTLAIGVAPIALANYLDRTGIVTRTSPNELSVAQLHTWIEPLDIQVRRVVARNLALLLGTERVFVLPEQRLMPLDNIVEIAVERFDIEVAAAAAAVPATELTVLEGRWTLFAKESRELVRTAPFRIEVAVATPASFEARTAAMSTAVERLSRAIATAIAGGAHPGGA